MKILKCGAFVCCVMLSVSLPSAAEQASHGDKAHSPYVDYTGRDIKALSTEQIADYRQGRGMGLALAAELNHYPGPRHVLDLADKLDLSEQQLTQTQALFEQMHAQAVALGKRIIFREGELDQAFASGEINSAILAKELAEIARLQGELRNVHLQTHLRMRELLTRHQIHIYEQARGYAGHGHSHGG